jgi:hypothetical protein
MAAASSSARKRKEKNPKTSSTVNNNILMLYRNHNNNKELEKGCLLTSVGIADGRSVSTVALHFSDVLVIVPHGRLKNSALLSYSQSYLKVKRNIWTIQEAPFLFHILRGIYITTLCCVFCLFFIHPPSAAGSACLSLIYFLFSICLSLCVVWLC